MLYITLFIINIYHSVRTWLILLLEKAQELVVNVCFRPIYVNIKVSAEMDFSSSK